MPSIKYAIEHKAKAVILMSHLGRPDGKAVEKYSLAPVADELSKLLDTKVAMMKDCVGSEVEEYVKNAKDGMSLLRLISNPKAIK